MIDRFRLIFFNEHNCGIQERSDNKILITGLSIMRAIKILKELNAKELKKKG